MKRRDFIRNAVITVPAVSVVRSGLIGVAAADTSAAPVERYASLVRPLKLEIEGDWHFQEDPKERGESEGWFRGGKVKAHRPGAAVALHFNPGFSTDGQFTAL